jgi:hypothetical protein
LQQHLPQSPLVRGQQQQQQMCQAGLAKQQGWA